MKSSKVKLQYYLYRFILKKIPITRELFDEEWYLNQYHDVKFSQMSAIEHYLNYGISENRDPSPFMFTKFYREKVKNFPPNADVLLHFIFIGYFRKIISNPLLSTPIKYRKLREINNSLRKDINRTNLRINIQRISDWTKNFWNPDDIYVSNVDRKGVFTEIEQLNDNYLLIRSSEFTKFGKKTISESRIKLFRNELIGKIDFRPRSLIVDDLKNIDVESFRSDFTKITLNLKDFKIHNEEVSKMLNEKDLDKGTNEMPKPASKKALNTIRDLIQNDFLTQGSPFIKDISPPRIDNTYLSMIISCKRPNKLIQFFKLMSNQNFKNFEVLLARHNFNYKEKVESDITIRKYQLETGISVRVFDFSNEIVISDILNFLINCSKYEFITKIDDDDIYGPNHLLELVCFGVYTEASFLGKSPMFFYNASTNDLYFDLKQNLFFDASDEISGSSMLFKKTEILKLGGVPYCTKNPDYVLRQLYKNRGLKIFRIYGLNHVIYRTSDESHNHTWSDDEIFTDKEIVDTLSLNDLIEGEKQIWQI